MKTPKGILRAGVWTACLLLAVCAAQAALVEIGPGAIIGPRILDFEGVPTGNIAGNDPLFTGFGIVSVGLLNTSDFNDIYGVRANSSRALWANVNGLAIVDPGVTGVANLHTYDILFLNPLLQFGFGTHDQNDPNLGPYIRVTAFLGLANVGTIDLGSGIGTADLNMFYLENSQPFNRIEIQSLGNSGFAIDNLTVATPEPATFAITALGLIAVGLFRRRRRWTLGR